MHDIPLLAETGQAANFDAVIVVDDPTEVQVERMTTLRGLTREEAESRMAAQATREQRLAIATHVIDNTGTLDDLRGRVAEVVEVLGRIRREPGCAIAGARRPVVRRPGRGLPACAASGAPPARAGAPARRRCRA